MKDFPHLSAVRVVHNSPSDGRRRWQERRRRRIIRSWLIITAISIAVTALSLVAANILLQIE